MADPVQIDLESFTMEEIETLEDLANKPLSALFPQGAMTGAGLRGAYFLFQRRTDPSLTWEDTAGLTIKDATAALGETTSDPPTDAAD